MCVVFVCVAGAGGGSATGIYWVEARDTGKHPTMHRTASLTTITLYLVQNASSAEVEKPCSGVLFFSYVRHFKNHFVFI